MEQGEGQLRDGGGAKHLPAGEEPLEGQRLQAGGRWALEEFWWWQESARSSVPLVLISLLTRSNQEVTEEAAVCGECVGTQLLLLPAEVTAGGR